MLCLECAKGVARRRRLWHGPSAHAAARLDAEPCFRFGVRFVDHWIAFVLLVIIGGRMVRAGLSEAPDVPAEGGSLASGWALLTVAVATSIGAAAAGVTLPLLDQPVLFACAVIGVVTLILSTAGVLFGAVAGTLIGRRAELVGGIVLIGIGTKILIDHLFSGANY